MINLTTLLNETFSPGDNLRYTRFSQGASQGTTRQQGPIVVWNCTRLCNQGCVHCYIEADNTHSISEELDTPESKKFIEDLAKINVPVLLFSGGEPLMREDFWELASYAVSQGIRTILSSNGTLITPHTARDLKKAGISYAGISLDGVGSNHDQFRNRPGAFDNTLEAIRYCRDAGPKVGIRFTLTRRNLGQLDEIMRLVEEERIPRLCIYHLVQTGRGKNLQDEMVSPEEARETIDKLKDWTRSLFKRNLSKEILTVDNHADGVYLYLKLHQENNAQGKRARELLENNGGNRSGIALAAVDPEGELHPDQFSQDQSLGNIRERPFSYLWRREDSLLTKLRHRRKYLKGRCKNCYWLPLCNGNLRARAYAFYGDFWEEDPGCYLTDEEIYNP